MGNPLDLLPGHRALGAARPLLGVLVHELTTWGLDDPRLVGLGGIAVPLPVGQALHHVSVVSAAGSRGLGQRVGGEREQCLKAR